MIDEWHSTNHKKGNTGSRGQSGSATPINPPTDLQQSTSNSDDTTSTLTPSIPPTKLSPKTLSRPAILSVRSQQKLRAKMQAEAGTAQKVEHREQGNVKMGVYKRYFQASSAVGVVAYMVCMVMQQACSISESALRLNYLFGANNRDSVECVA